ncbi:hypothetical protein G3570_00335 [Balneolaceae bacterium YR4-1]|uniref:Uncharacterized protein n=1 Tax=Halalkalibaculum roseum TaxID=2709311 RepID=A0A6M1SI76_9BACT|nr:hypothetical protein [Halalkalibaculum roseum]NGP75061.1 hypothetical protein [Halalkalibaculum roseum]
MKFISRSFLKPIFTIPLFFFIALGLAACQEVTPTADSDSKEAIKAPYATNGELTSGCYTVSFNVVFQEGPAGAEGVVSGDLEGTSTFRVESNIKMRGNTWYWVGSADWDITGGSIPGLNTFSTTIENRNITTDRPGSPAIIFENMGRMHDLSGVHKAKLTYKGTFDIPTLTGDWDFRGVICI